MEVIRYNKMYKYPYGSHYMQQNVQASIWKSLDATKCIRIHMEVIRYNKM